jgi:hypothetical protein
MGLLRVGRKQQIPCGNDRKKNKDKKEKQRHKTEPRYRELGIGIREQGIENPARPATVTRLICQIP